MEQSYQISGYRIEDGAQSKAQKAVNRCIPSGGRVNVEFFINGIFSRREILRSK